MNIVGNAFALLPATDLFGGTIGQTRDRFESRAVGKQGVQEGLQQFFLTEYDLESGVGKRVDKMWALLLLINSDANISTKTHTTK